MALRRAARSAGAEIHEQTEVTAASRTAGGEWRLTTSRGEIVAEHVVCATGNYARQIGRMFGLNVPAIPVEHQYIVYDESPRAPSLPRAAAAASSPCCASPTSRITCARSGSAGFSGRTRPARRRASPTACRSRSARTCFRAISSACCRTSKPRSGACRRSRHCGIKDIVNGPISYTPDGSPLIGPAWKVRNLWLNEGHSFGITAAGGAGWQLAQWIVEGEPGIDMLAVDPRRFGPYTSRRYVVAKNEETYRNVFTVHYPDEEREDARPAKTSPSTTS